MKVLKSVCAISLLLLFGACSDYNELNMQKLVNGAGIDKISGKTQVSIVCAEVSENGGAEIIRSSGKSFFDAVRNTASESDKKLYWGHMGVLLIGESALPGIDDILNSLLRARDVYHDIFLVATKGESADEVLSSGNGDVSESIYNMFANEKNSKRFSSLRIWELLREREEFGVYVLPTVSLREESLWLSGGAVIRNGRLSGYLSGEEMFIRSIVTEKSPGGYLPVLSSGENSVSFELLSAEISKKEKDKNTVIEIYVALSPAEVRGELSEKEMKELAEKYILLGMKKLLYRIEQENLGDILMLGKGRDYRNIKITCTVTVGDLLGGGK